MLIVAAGAGRRMRSYGPKALLPLTAGETVLTRQVRLVREVWPQAAITVVVGHEADRVLRHLPAGVMAVENERHDETGLARSLELGLRVCLRSRLLVLHGDLVFSKEALERQPGSGSWVSVTSPGNLLRSEEVGVVVSAGRVTHFDYGLPTLWAQMALFDGGELTRLRRLLFRGIHRLHLDWEVFNALLGAGGSLRALDLSGLPLCDIDHPRDIEIASRASH